MSQKTYRIGEAAAKLNLKSYVLRFWETEFSQIAPIRTGKGQRLYTESDLVVLGRIRYLLHERGLTIDGARRLLREEAAKGFAPADAASSFSEEIPQGMLENMESAGSEDALREDAQTAGACEAATVPAEKPAEKPAGMPVGLTLSPVKIAPIKITATVSAKRTENTITVPPVDAIRAPEQAPLFAQAENVPLASPHPAEMHAIITELEAIRRLLAPDTSGDIS